MDLNNKITEVRKITRDSRFIQARVEAEKEVQELLNQKAGNFSESDFDLFCRLCNTESVPGKGHWQDNNNKRFGMSFRSNISSMKNCLERFNQGVNDLWSNDDVLMALEKFASRKITGAGTGVPTTILYLKKPQFYNYWTKSRTPIVNKFWPFYHSQNCWQEYLNFNETVNKNLRDAYSLNPYEIDYIIFALGECM